MNIPVKIKRLKQDAKIPTRGSAAAAGYDAYACIPHTVIIPPWETVKIGTGIAVEIPEGYFMGVFARSGLATKRGLRPANCVGIVDSDYRGEVIVAIHNDSDTEKEVDPDERIAQLVILPFLTWDINEVEELGDTDRGKGGFGSTGR